MKLITLLTFLVASLFGVPSHGQGDAIVDQEEDPRLYNEVDFAQSVGKEPHFIMFFAPWCGHCKKLKPTWEELGDFYNDQNPGVITVAKVDCTTDTKLCSENGVTGYPTLKIFQPGKEAVRHTGGRDLKALKEFVSKILGIEREDKKDKADVQVEDGLYQLTVDTFDAHIATGTHFIKFFAPWCGHCKRMEPAWKDLASKLKDSEIVKIAKVDCTENKKVCSDNGVRGYPTLKWFDDGEELEKYEGGRSLEDFIKYVKKMTGKDPFTDEKKEEKKEMVEEKEDSSEIVDGLFELDMDNFEPLTTSGDFFIKFFAPWCGHCKRMEPAWKELAKFYEDSDEVRIGRVDCTSHSALCQKNGVRGYPTLKYFRNGEALEGSPAGRDFQNLKSFVEKMMGKEDVAENKEEPVEEEEPQQEEQEKAGAIELDDTTFGDVIKTGIVFVKFYAPWCGHCKRLAPTWDQLAEQDFSEIGRSVLIAKIDCTKYSKVCGDNEVRGYPTLKLYVNGELKSKYQGSRTLEALKDYILENAMDSGESIKEQTRDEL